MLLTLVWAVVGCQEPVLGPAEEFQVSFTQEVVCRSPGGGGSAGPVEIRAAVPADNERQTIAGLELRPAAAEFSTDSHGNRIAVWRQERLAAGATFSAGWTCRATLRSIEHRPDPASLRPVAEAPEDIRRRYLAGGRKYGLDDAALVAAAESIRAAATDPLDLALRTNEFLRDRLRYVNDSQWDDAPVTLKNGHGSCSEYNFLFVALCRINGLPARSVGATARRTDETVYVDTVHHRWSEVFLPGYGWFPVDVSRNDGEDGAGINQYFGRTPAGLLVLGKGDGGDREPLGWGYVADVDAPRHGDAALERRKRFTWERRSGSDPAAGAAGASGNGGGR